jgi:three-Cys-motif partner protein
VPRRSKLFWNAAKDWSRRKHLILSYYLTPAAPKLRTQSPDGRVVVLDGFAGRGKYADNSPGSPIYMGQLAETCRVWNNPVALHIYNVEPDAASFDDLCASTRKWSDAGYLHNLRGTFQEKRPVVLQEAGSAPLFAFLDPFRPSHLNFQDIVPLLARTALTEVCIVFHTPAVIRMLRAVRPAARTSEEQKEKLRVALNEVFGGRRWERLLDLPIISPQDVFSCVTEQVRSHVVWRGLFVCWTDVRERYQGRLKYNIIFLTRHPDGVRLMNDAFCKEGQMAYAEAATPPAPQLDLGFDDESVPVVERTNEQRLVDLCDSLLALGKEHPGKIWKRYDLRFASMVRRFGEFSWAEHRQAIERLLHLPLPPNLIAPAVQPKKTGKIITNQNTQMQFQF